MLHTPFVLLSKAAPSAVLFVLSDLSQHGTISEMLHPSHKAATRRRPSALPLFQIDATQPGKQTSGGGMAGRLEHVAMLD